MAPPSAPISSPLLLPLSSALPPAVAVLAQLFGSADARRRKRIDREGPDYHAYSVDGVASDPPSSTQQRPQEEEEELITTRTHNPDLLQQDREILVPNELERVATAKRISPGGRLNARVTPYQLTKARLLVTDEGSSVPPSLRRPVDGHVVSFLHAPFLDLVREFLDVEGPLFLLRGGGGRPPASGGASPGSLQVGGSNTFRRQGTAQKMQQAGGGSPGYSSDAFAPVVLDRSDDETDRLILLHKLLPSGLVAELFCRLVVVLLPAPEGGGSERMSGAGGATVYFESVDEATLDPTAAKKAMEGRLRVEKNFTIVSAKECGYLVLVSAFLSSCPRVRAT